MTKPRSTGSQQWRKVKTEFRARAKAAGAECWIGHHPIDYNAPPLHANSFEADHDWPVATHPHLECVISNLRASCCRCNRSRGGNPPEQGRTVYADW